MSETADSTETTDTTETASVDSSDEADSSGTDDADDGPEETTDTPATADPSEETAGPDPRLLEELDQHIREARAAAEDALGDSEQSFVDSGEGEAKQEDDQTIAPPD